MFCSPLLSFLLTIVSFVLCIRIMQGLPEKIIYGVEETPCNSGGSRILKRGVPACMTDRIKRARARARGCGMWRTYLPRKIFDFRPSEVAFGAVLG